MLNDIAAYFADNGNTYLGYVWQHISLSFEALLIALIIALPLGYFSYEKPFVRQLSTLLTQGLRVIPSLGILFIMIPFIGVGRLPALIALVILGIPPILLNTIVGFASVSENLLETALGLGMTRSQLLTKVQFPLALPHILNGIKLALMAIIASATIASTITAGGLGSILFDGLRTMSLPKLLWGIILTVSLSLLVNLILYLVEELVKNESVS